MAIDAARHDRDVERAAGISGARPGDSPLTRAPVTAMLPVRDPDPRATTTRGCWGRRKPRGSPTSRATSCASTRIWHDPERSQDLSPQRLEEHRVPETRQVLVRALCVLPGSGVSVPRRQSTGHAGAPAICAFATATVAAAGSATPFLTAVISARIEIAISGGVRLPM